MDAVRPSAIAVNIGELQIEGLDAAGRFDVARGLQQELARLLAETGVPRGLLAGEAGRPATLDSGAVAPADLGRALARALYEGWR
jgi:hypothetical protein